MDNYRKKLDGMHAPESLITATINRIHEEEKLMEQSDGVELGNETAASGKSHRVKRNRFAGVISIAAAAAVLILVMGMNAGNSGRMELIYNTVSETIVRSTLGEQVECDVDVDTFNEYLGVDIIHPVENAELVKSELYMEYDGDKVIADEACVYYNVDGEQLMIRYSKTLDVVPDQLESGEASEVNGLPILAGVSENEKERIAAFESDGIRYFIMSNSMDQETFEQFLTDFLENRYYVK